MIFERRGGLALATLNRPKALNAVTLGMYRAFQPLLTAWAGDPAVRAVLLQGAGDRAFCAGGDVRAIYDARGAPSRPGDYKFDMFHEEYLFIRDLHRLAKPRIAICQGITMGGGMGLSVNGSHRVATANTVFAMPEIFIGSIPDVGATRFFNRCPGLVGHYLALTGARVGAADALWCGLATHFVAQHNLPALTAALEGIDWRDGAAPAQVDAVLARFAADPGPATLPALRPAIDRCFALRSVEEIVGALRQEEGAWAREALAAMERASPLSLKLTLRQMRLGAGMELEDALVLEFRLIQHLMAGSEFYEGVRAVLVDKDKQPRWRLPTLAEVSDAEVERHFESLGERELRL